MGCPGFRLPQAHCFDQKSGRWGAVRTPAPRLLCVVLPAPFEHLPVPGQPEAHWFSWRSHPLLLSPCSLGWKQMCVCVWARITSQGWHVWLVLWELCRDNSYLSPLRQRLRVKFRVRSMSPQSHAAVAPLWAISVRLRNTAFVLSSLLRWGLKQGPKLLLHLTPHVDNLPAGPLVGEWL